MTRRNGDFPPNVRDQALHDCGKLCVIPFCKTPISCYGGPKAWLSHVYAASPRGPRADRNLPPSVVRSLANALPTCPSCANIIDTYEHEFPVDVLIEIGAEARKLASYTKAAHLGPLYDSLKSAMKPEDICQILGKESYTRYSTSRIRRIIGELSPNDRQRVMELISNCLLFSIDEGMAWFAGFLATMLHVEKSFWRPPSKLITALSKCCRTIMREGGPKFVQVVEPLAFALHSHGDTLAEGFLVPFVIDIEWRTSDFLWIRRYAVREDTLLDMVEEHLRKRQHSAIDIAGELGRFVELAAQSQPQLQPEMARRMAGQIVSACRDLSPKLAAQALTLVRSNGVQVE